MGLVVLNALIAAMGLVSLNLQFLKVLDWDLGPSLCLDGIYRQCEPVMKKWTPERNAVGHTHGSGSATNGAMV
jgi:hypothetical protein